MTNSLDILETESDLGDVVTMAPLAGSAHLAAEALPASADIEAERQLAAAPQAVSILIGTEGNDTLLGDTNDNEIFGLGGNDQINGGFGNDVLHGGDGNDFLVGGHGDDVLDGGAGADHMAGIDGFDIVTYDAASLAVTVNLFDTSFSAGDAAGDVYVDIDAFQLSVFDDTFIAANGGVTVHGGAGSDSLLGGSGNDLLDGGSGNDTLQNGGGSDSLLGGAGDDLFGMTAGLATISGGDGHDIASYGLASGAVIVNLADTSQNGGDAAGQTYVGIEEFILSGNDDLLIGSDAADIVNGASGNDTLNGGKGDDQLFGGNSSAAHQSGNDTLFGGDGNDSLDGGGNDDDLHGDDGDDTLFGGHGQRSGAGFLFGGNDSLFGGNGHDNLDGGDGDDILDGGAGADILIGGDGLDTASYADATVGLMIDLTRASSVWTGDAQGDALTSIEAFGLTDFNDIFSGDANANNVAGGRGDDRINGGGGDDLLNGGQGNDIVQGGAGSDTLIGDGAQFANSYGSDHLNGGAGDDFLYGDNSNPFRTGGVSDFLDGGAGADLLDGGDGYDTAAYRDAATGVSIDLTTDSSTWTGDAHGDTLTSIEAFDLSDFADVFHGDGADNTVISRGGDDQLFGGGGNDTLVADTGNDILQGGLGADKLAGQTGADIFKYAAVEESSGAVINGVKQVDDITDFTKGEDKIDLSAIDANPNAAGDQAFTFLADPAHHTGDWTGLVWAVTDSRGTTTVFASTDADADPEMQIFTPHTIQFTGGDFIL